MSLENYSNLKIRKATEEDISILVLHHRLMFEEIYSLENIDNKDLNWDEMNISYKVKLKNELVDNSCIAFVIEDNKNIIASGAVTISTLVPTPNDNQYKIGYIHSIYTNTNYRRKGLAKKILQNLLKHCKKKGIKRFKLNTSQNGKHLYEYFGFIFDKKSMSLLIE